MKNILQISDLHVSNIATGMGERQLKDLLSTLLSDIKELPKPDTIFITGDIAYSGKEHEYQSFKKYFLTPLTESLELSLDRIVITPGNHDLDRKAWGVSDSLMREQLVQHPNEEIITNVLKEHIATPRSERLSAFIKFRDEIDSVKSNKALLSNSIFSAYNIDGVGVGCLNSSWLSTGDDLNKLIIGEWQLRELLREMHPFEQKVLLLHHPISWLHSHEKGLITDLIHSNKIKAMFYGHMHEFSMTKVSQFSEDSVMKLQSGKFDISRIDNRIGYALLALHSQNNFESGEIHFRKYEPKKCKFISWVERVENGVLNYSLVDTMPFNGSIFSEISQKKIDLIEREIFCNVGLPNEQQKKLTEIFVCPSMSIDNGPAGSLGLDSVMSATGTSESKFNLEKLLIMDESYIVLGGENCGKTTLAMRLAIQYLQEQANNNFDQIVYYLDVKGASFNKPRKIKDGLLDFYCNDVDSSSFQAKIERSINQSNSIVIIDSLETLDKHGLKSLFEFIVENSQARFLLCGQLVARQILLEYTTPIIDRKRFQYVTLKNLNRSHVRELVGRWTEQDLNKKKTSVKHALRVVSGAGMPSNPFVYTMLLSIRDRQQTSSRSFMHEADLIENFIEIIMQKHVFSVTNSPQYKDLLLFLGYLASKMHSVSIYSLSETNMLECVVSFNKIIFQDFSFSGYLDPIISSGIVKREGGRYRFSQLCFFNYVYAHWLGKQSRDYEILGAEIDFIRFDKVVEYISAINKSDTSLLEYMSKKIDESWNQLLEDDKLTDLGTVESEMVSCVQHDFLDLIKDDSLDSELVDDQKSEEEVDAAMDEASPLNDQAIVDVKPQQENRPPLVTFFENLSLYARVFRAAEHIMNADVTMRHFSSIYEYYMRSIAYNVRSFDIKQRPVLLQKVMENIDYAEMSPADKKQIEKELNALVNFVISAIPNFTVAMMNSDFFNQRQKPRIEKFRSDTDDNLGRLLLTYSLCELDDVDIVAEIKSQRYDKTHESTSLIIKIIELIMFNFSISKEDKKSLDQLARKILKDRKSKQLLTNLSLISNKLIEGSDRIILNN